MNDLEIRLEAEYESAFDSEPPPSGVDVELARGNGRTLRRRRRAVTGGSGLLAVALSAAIAFGLLPGSGLGHGAADTASGADYSGESYPPADDPLATRVTFGWLPYGVSVAGVTTQSPDTGDVTAGGAGVRFTASVLPRGEHWAGNCPTPPPTFPVCDPSASKVNGRAAYWVIEPGNPEAQFGGVELRWQYSDDAWADLDAAVPSTMKPATVSELMHRIAENVHVSRFKAVPMPFHLSRVPAGWQFMDAVWVDGPQGRQASADPGDWYGASLTIGIPGSGPGSGGMHVSANPAAADFTTATELKKVVITAPPARTRTLTVDGHPAIIFTDSDHTALVVHDVGGFDVVVEAIDPAGLALAGTADSIVDYYHTITFFSADRATWTTHVLG